MKIHIKRDLAGSYGITMQDIGETLSAMMSDGYVNRINMDGRSYEVILRSYANTAPILNPSTAFT